MASYEDVLYKKMWSTKGSRFNSHARLNRVNRFSLVTVSTLSVYVILLSIYAILFKDKIDDFGHTVLNFINIGLSIGIAVFSVVEYSKGLSAQADRMLHCALELGALYNLYQYEYMSKSLTPISIVSYTKKYNECILSYKDNHHNMDYDYFILQNIYDYPHVNNRTLFAIKAIFNYYVFSVLSYLVIILAPAALFVILLIYGIIGRFPA